MDPVDDVTAEAKIPNQRAENISFGCCERNTSPEASARTLRADLSGELTVGEVIKQQLVKV